ncbi:MAG: NADH-quinone oxidoreductase subunit L [Flavobacteriaceae bacterium]|nr:NADH-quinone oxidoreductase subunit L [Flavobacteriaceae bacterium]
MEYLLYTLIFLPLLGFVTNGLLGKFLPKIWVGVWATLLVFVSFLLAINLFWGMSADTPPKIFTLFEWFRIQNLKVDFAFQLDQLSIMMVMIITGIGSLIHLYSIGYMWEDKGFYKFFAYLNLFVFSMLLLVLGSNYLILFIGWEGVGLCSFLLIGFWFQNEEYGKAARKAFIMNRIGDLGLLLGIFAMAYHFKTLSYIELQENIIFESVEKGIILWITLSFFVGAMGKSAQIPLFTWLPDAMAGPTPVSALIHAATMVTAGIYLIVRSNFLYDLAPFTLNFILIIGLATSLIAGFIALRQNDIKKVLAYSTVSQLGFMFIALGVGAYTTAMFHLLTHAFFKALLFLGSGSVIHAMGGEQDMRWMGGLKKKIPATYWTFLLGTLAICGIPPLSGMISKDEILLMVYAKNPIIWALTLLGALLTTIYMFRLLFLTFFGEFRGSEAQEKKIHESPWMLLFPLMVLAVFSVLGGFVNLPHFIAHGDYQFLSQWLFSVLVNPIKFPKISFAEEMILLAITLIIVGSAIGLMYQIYVVKGKKALPEDEYKNWEKLSAKNLYIDYFYQNFIVKWVEILAKILAFFDKKILDALVNFTGLGAEKSGQFFRRMQSGSVENYLLLISLGMGIILIIKILM